SPARRLKAAEQSKNHVFCFAVLSLKTKRMRSFKRYMVLDERDGCRHVKKISFCNFVYKSTFLLHQRDIIHFFDVFDSVRYFQPIILEHVY
ncbi:MAG: hypothetical protein LBM00_03820, partial [Deltaproteobacteria bacterium]|nr:hypothetical protein [Deltaproteobacteria bacterium]